MSFWTNAAKFIPEVNDPEQKRLLFKEKLKWTLLILVLFFVLGAIPLFGLGQNALENFEFLSVVLGAQFGSLISLGIGPLVTSSIVLQLLVGSGLVNLNTATPEGKTEFQSMTRVFSIVFILLEAAIYVFFGGLAPPADLVGTALYFRLELLLVFQLIIGGILIMFMASVIDKWGFSQGISLFIAANVAQSLFVQLFSFEASPQLPDVAIGAIPSLFQSLAAGNPTAAMLRAAAILATILVFGLAVYAQSMKVEIPLSFGRIRGHGIRWPLSFLYTSNIPVILIAALIANLQLFARLLSNVGYPLLGTFQGNSPVSGIVLWFSAPNIVQAIITRTITPLIVAHAIVYILILMAGSVVFSYFWIQTANMDAASQAKNIMNSGLQIPGFRRDPRVLEHLLSRYILPLTVMGGLAIGFLAGFADITGALANGTSIILAVMIVYKLYEEIAKQHMMDMHPMLRKFMAE